MAKIRWRSRSSRARAHTKSAASAVNAAQPISSAINMSGCRPPPFLVITVGCCPRHSCTL
jgi:hypothetical protein